MFPRLQENLKILREQKGIPVAQIQELLGMENPQSIYTWENAGSKVLPRLDNLVTLAKLYKVSIDELIIIRSEQSDGLAVCEPRLPFGMSDYILSFVQAHASRETKRAMERYYGFSIG